MIFYILSKLIYVYQYFAICFSSAMHLSFSFSIDFSLNSTWLKFSLNSTLNFSLNSTLNSAAFEPFGFRETILVILFAIIYDLFKSPVTFVVLYVAFFDVILKVSAVDFSSDQEAFDHITTHILRKR